MNAPNTGGEASRAHSIEGFCRAFAVGRTYAYAEIKAGRLRARKAGRRTIILQSDAETWAASLPERSVNDE